MSTQAEKFWDKDCFVLLVADDASIEEFLAWHEREPKLYKIRVINPKDHLMDTPIGYVSDRVWNGLDGEEVMFRSDFRPRAGYLYMRYYVAILRRSWPDVAPTDTLKD